MTKTDPANFAPDSKKKRFKKASTSSGTSYLVIDRRGK